jgi:hypothetical protein
VKDREPHTSTGEPPATGSPGRTPRGAGNGRGTDARQTRDDPDVVDLIGRLTRQSAHLAQAQVDLVQAEMREGVQDIKTAIGAFAGAAIFGLAGLVVVLMGAGFLLAPVIGSIGLAVLIVGGVALLLAAILFGSGKSKASATNLKPDRTIHTAEDMPDAATGQMHHKESRHG